MKRRYDYNPQDEFFESLRASDLDAFRTALQHGANPHLLFSAHTNAIDYLSRRVDPYGDMWDNDRQMLEQLIALGVDARSQAPLVAAMKYNERPEVIGMLLEAGANPFDADSAGSSAFSIALSQSPSQKAVELLAPFRNDLSDVTQHLLNVADPVTVTRFLLERARHPVFSRTLSEIVPLLFDLDIDAHSKPEAFFTLLKDSLFHPPVLHYFLQRAPQLADVTDDVTGETVLHQLIRDVSAYEYTHAKSVTELLSRIEIDLQDYDGYTPLNRAVHLLEEMIELDDRSQLPFLSNLIRQLLERNARVDLSNSEGETIADVMDRHVDVPEFEPIREWIRQCHSNFAFRKKSTRNKRK